MPNTREKLIEAIEKEKPYIPVEDYEVGYNNGLVMAQTIVTQLCAEETKWISVKDRLPQAYTDVLAYRKSGCEVECCIDIQRNFWLKDPTSEYLVTHWMPLPQPPKGE